MLDHINEKYKSRIEIKFHYFITFFSFWALGCYNIAWLYFIIFFVIALGVVDVRDHVESDSFIYIDAMDEIYRPLVTIDDVEHLIIHVKDKKKKKRINAQIKLKKIYKKVYKLNNLKFKKKIYISKKTNIKEMQKKLNNLKESIHDIKISYLDINEEEKIENLRAQKLLKAEMLESYVSKGIYGLSKRDFNLFKEQVYYKQKVSNF